MVGKVLDLDPVFEQAPYRDRRICAAKWCEPEDVSEQLSKHGGAAVFRSEDTNDTAWRRWHDRAWSASAHRAETHRVVARFGPLLLESPSMPPGERHVAPLEECSMSRDACAAMANMRLHGRVRAAWMHDAEQ
eukprot:CAMPEP_0196674826 /NCGR_PEP_ID=MMETSP1090-20130531/3705_1 /TAXON_ID=37098 /ORGANISM="Isochrysis sp, Strain CCMP1244" /LENGTH=132 /DNA_ID=CAMNT_0042012631 /DNA_START=717 /DNA_END=1116 /DNA_ORIENTATION=+